jgi:DNA-binding NarL/FixJ family response regulator
MGSVRTRVVVADDRELVRVGIRRLVEQEPGLSLVGDADNTATAVALAESLRPDVLVLDAHMPGLCGAAAVREVRRRAPGVRILVISACADPTFGEALRRAGAAGFLPKSHVFSHLSKAIRAVAAGAWCGPPASSADDAVDGDLDELHAEAASNAQREPLAAVAMAMP